MSGMTGNLLAGKRGLIMGVANERSIAWGIAAAAAAQGAELAFPTRWKALASACSYWRNRSIQTF